MTNPLVTGIVQSGGTEGARPLAGAIVYLWDTQGPPDLEGANTTNEDGRFEFHVSFANADGIYYATAMLPGDILLAAVVGPALDGPIVINELTTVAAAYSLAQFIDTTQFHDGGPVTGSTPALRVAAGMSENLASSLTGEPSEVLLKSPNADETNALRSTRSLANLLAPCVREQAGAWDTLRQLATPPGGEAPLDTFQAMVNIARNPANNVAGIYQQTQVLELYTPSLSTPPAAPQSVLPPDAWTLAVKVNDTGERSPDYKRIFGGPANISWDRNGYAWISNNVFQGYPTSGDFVVVLQPNGKPSDGTNGTPKSPVVGGGLLGPGFGVVVGLDGNAWVGSFGWGPEDSIPAEGIVSKFDASGNPVVPGGYVSGTERVQGMAVDRRNNIWAASYGNDSVVVFPNGDANTPIIYPVPGTHEQAPGTCTFGVAVVPTTDPEEAPSAWVTYGAGLGWPQAFEGTVAKLEIEDGKALRCTLHLPLGAALKGVAVDSQGNAWVASGGNDTVYMVTPAGVPTGFSGSGGVLGPWGVAVDGNDDVWVANFGRMGATEDYTDAGISKLAGVGSPSGLPVGTALTPDSGYTLPSAGDPVMLPTGEPLYDYGETCYSPLMRMTSVTIDQAGNIWAVNNWKPRFGSDFEPNSGNPGGDGIVIFVGLAKPPASQV